MCGIAGFLAPPAETSPALQAQVRRMADAIAHRGPDSSGHWLDPAHGIALGHRRLAVVDLSPQGAQPMVSHCGRYVVAFNGEIYNHLELRAELDEIAGALPWRGHSDTETLAAAFAHWGVVDTLPRLVGMFAIAVWDRQEANLTLARDRLGEKPLYWGHLPGGTLAFGSELRALRAHARWTGDIDRDALTLFLRLGMVPAPYTIHRGVHKLEAGAWARFAHGQPDAHGRFWQLDSVARDGVAARGEAAGWTDTEATDRLEALLMQAVGGQLLSDVPLGAFLSGGVDSSTVVAMMTRCAPGAVRTFSIGFDQPGFNEAEHARAVAAHLGTRHTELMVTAAEALAVVPRLPTLYDEPFADSSQIPTALVTAMARREVTVALSGDGGDELFAGYLRHTANDAARVWGLAPPRLRQALAGVIERLPQRPRPRDPLRYLKRFARSFEQDVAGRNACWGMAIKPETAATLYAPGFAERVAHVDPLEAYRARFREADTDRDEERVLWADFALYLPDDILVKVDVATMAHGLESRAPLLDHVLVEWALRVPLRHKVSLGRRKRLLRRLARQLLPREVARAPKRGFAVPIDAWFRGPLVPMFRDLVLAPDARVREVLSPAAVEGLLAQHLARTWDWQHELWAVLWLELWFREVLEGARAPLAEG